MTHPETNTLVVGAIEQLFAHTNSVKLSRRDVAKLLEVSPQSVQYWAQGRLTDNVHTFLRIVQLNAVLEKLTEEERAMMTTDINSRKAWVALQTAA